MRKSLRNLLFAAAFAYAGLFLGDVNVRADSCQQESAHCSYWGGDFQIQECNYEYGICWYLCATESGGWYAACDWDYS
jgi:hypothetical protein